MSRVWPITFCLAIAYFLTGYAGLMLPASGTHVTLVWLPTGIAVAAFYRWGIGCWPGVTIGALAVNMAIGTSFPLALSISVGNTLGPLLATGILLRAGFQKDLKRSRDILLLNVAALVGMLVTASVGVLSLKLAGQLSSGPFLAWLIWWAGDVLGVVTAAPLIFVMNRSELRNLWSRRSEFLGLVASVTCATALVFFINGMSGPALAIAFIPLPLVALAAIRFGPIGASLAVILLSFGAAAGTSAGFGPFYRSTPTDSLLTLSLFMATTASVAWVVSMLTVSKLAAVDTQRILERALEADSFGVVVADIDRRIIYANSGFSSLTGYSERELLGKSCAILQGPDTDPATIAELKRSLHSTGGFDGEILNYRKDGSTFWNALIITPLVNKRGERNGFLGIQRDVTARRLGQQALFQSEMRFRAIFDLEPECVKVVSPEGRLVEMNPAGLAMIEADSFEQVRGSRMESLIAAEDRSAFLKLSERVTKLGELGECTFAITGLKGSKRWLETHAVPYRNEKQEIIGLLAVTRDITQQKRTMDELERTVATLKLFIDSVPGVIAFVDADETYRMVNRQCEAFFGLPADQIVNRRVAEMHSPEAYRVIAPRLREALGGRSVHYQDSIHRFDGSRFWYEARYVPRMEADGRVLGVYVMVFDISERMRAERALKESEARLNSFFVESPLGMAIFDSEGRWSHMNPTLAAINGPTVEAHIGKRPDELLSQELAEGLTASVRHILETGEADVNREVSGVTPAQPSVTRHWLFTQSPIMGPDQRITGVGVVAIETTAQKQSEEARRLSEERFRLYVDHAPNGVFVIDSQGRYKDVNPAACRQTGYSREEILNMGIVDLTPPEAVAQSLQAFEKLKADGFVEYEQSLRCKSGAIRWFALAAARLTNGDFIGFTSDIQGLKEAANALRQSRDRLEYLVSSCPAVIYTTKPSGDYATTFMSENVRSLLGFDPNEFLSDPGFCAKQIHPDDVAEIYEGLPKLLEIGRQRHEFRIRNSTGEYRWLDDEMVLIRDADGKPKEIIGYLVDITDRKRIEQALSKSEAQSRLALDAAELGTWRHLVFQDTLELDERAQKIMHFEQAKLTSEEFTKRIHPDDLNRLEEERLRSAAFGADGSLATEHRILLPDGQVRWVSVRAKITFDYSDGVRVPEYVLGTVQDITERRLADETLLANETRLRLALGAANQGLYDLNVQTGECLVSPEYAIMLGYDPADFRETNAAWRERLHPDDRETVYQAYSEYVLGQRDEYRVEFRQRTKSGEWKWVLSIGAVVARTADGQPLRMLGTHTDITKRKQAEEELQELEGRQRLALDAARMGMWEWEIGSDELTWDDREQMLFGFEPGAFDSRMETFLNLIHPDDLAGVRQVLADAESGKAFDGEYRVRLSSGEIRWMHGSGMVVPKSDHRPMRLVGINYDITERKRAEETVKRILDGIAPRTGREFFRVLVDYLCNVCEVEFAFVGGIDPDNQESVKTIAVSHRGVATDNFTYDLHATPCERVVGQSLCSYPSGVQQAFPHDTMLVDMGIEGYIGTPLWFSNGQAAGLIVLLHNRPIANPEQAEVVLRVVAARAGAELERQRTDAALHESEERLRIFVENAPAGVAMLDREMKYLSYSRRWLTDYVLGEQNLIGRSHYEVFPDIPDRWKEIHRRCLTGIPERCEQDRFERADGTADYLRLEIQPWTDATGAIGGIVIFSESITRQVVAQEQLRTSLHEKESMLKEIHHRVKNNLQVISSLLSLQAANVTQPDASSVLAESQNRVRAMALVHEILYKSRELANVDLSSYLGELCGYLFRSYGVDSSQVQLDLDVEGVSISLDKTIPCGLIVNEAVSNSLKHAFPRNAAGKITIRARKELEGWIRLTLADDGVGLPTDLAIEKTPTLGLKLVQILSEQLGAKLSMKRTKGTQFEILFPQ
jgi:PAS domain S-box-containing protein